MPDSAFGVFATTGLRVASCQSIEWVADRFIDAMPEDLLQAERDGPRCNLGLSAAAFEACSDLAEMTLDRRVNYTGPKSEIVLIEGWVNGTPIGQLRSTMWRPEDSESFSKYIADRIVYKLAGGHTAFFASWPTSSKSGTNKCPSCGNISRQ